MKALIDRIEGELAVIVASDDDRVRFNLPIRYLPEGVRDGDHLDIVFGIDEDGREAELKRVESLQKSLQK